MDFSRERLFVARWRRILIPWRANTEAEAVRDLEHSCIATLLCMILFVGFSEFDSAWRAGFAVFAVMIGAVAAWLALRLRVIRRLFDLGGPQSFTDLQQQLLEQHRNAIRSPDRP